jgi:hypothetical protein
MRRTGWYAAVTRDEGNAADDVLMVDQGIDERTAALAPRRQRTLKKIFPRGKLVLYT